MMRWAWVLVLGLFVCACALTGRDVSYDPTPACTAHDCGSGDDGSPTLAEADADGDEDDDQGAPAAVSIAHGLPCATAVAAPHDAPPPPSRHLEPTTPPPRA